MAQNSIFATLLRSSWWISAAMALVLLVAAAASPNPAISAVLFSAALPFIVIAGIAAWKQRHAPSAALVQSTADAVRAMSWQTFSSVLHEGFRQDGCEIKRLTGEQVDFELRRKGRIAVVNAKRWKASRVGVQDLRELNDVRTKHQAHEAIYVTTGEISDQAAAYANANDIRFLSERELARLLRRVPKTAP